MLEPGIFIPRRVNGAINLQTGYLAAYQYPTATATLLV